MEINSQLIIDRLSQRMDLDRVYLLNYRFLNQEYHHLLLVLKPVNGLSHKVLKPIVELCLIGQENVSFEIILIGELLNKIKIGSMYYAHVSSARFNLYCSGKKNAISLGHKELKSVMEIAAELYKQVSPVSLGFLQGAETFAGQGSYLRAVFMLHQGIENHLRFLQTLIDGKANNVHHLNSRIKSLDEHFSTLKASFIGNTEEEKARFSLYDAAFNAVKQNKDLEISAVDASWLYDHSKFILDAVEQLYFSFMDGLHIEYERLLAEMEAQQLAKSKAAAEEKKSDTGTSSVKANGSVLHAFPWPEHDQSAIHHLLDQIRREHTPEQIMLLNYYVSNAHGRALFDYPSTACGTADIYLVVLKKRIGSCYFRKVSYGKVTAVISFLNTDFIAAKLQKGSRFSHTIWNESAILFRDPSYKPCYAIAPINWADTLSKIEHCWKRNSALMWGLLDILTNDNFSCRQLAVMLLNQLIVVGLHTYLYIRIGYAPPHISTEELIEWTCVCDKRVKAFFSSKDAVENILNAEVLKPMKGRIHALPQELVQLDMDYFKSRAKDIAYFLMDLGGQSLSYMEAKSGIGANQSKGGDDGQQ